MDPDQAFSGGAGFGGFGGAGGFGRAGAGGGATYTFNGGNAFKMFEEFVSVCFVFPLLSVVMMKLSTQTAASHTSTSSSLFALSSVEERAGQVLEAVEEDSREVEVLEVEDFREVEDFWEVEDSASQEEDSREVEASEEKVSSRSLQT